MNPAGFWGAMMDEMVGYMSSRGKRIFVFLYLFLYFVFTLEIRDGGIDVWQG